MTPITTTTHATNDMASLVLAMQNDVASLQASQITANREIAYLRDNQDRVVREVSSEFRRLRRQVKTMQIQFDAMQESQKRLRRRVQRIEATASASPSGSSSVPPIDNQTPSQSRPRRLELKRQGAFHGGDINNLPWDELNDVRGFNPDIPRYHWSASSPPPMWTHNPHVSRKRTRDAFHEDSTSFFEQCMPIQHGKAESGAGASPTKRRRVSSAVRIARKTITPYHGSRSRPSPTKNNSIRRSTSFLSGVIAGVSSVFLS